MQEYPKLQTWILAFLAGAPIGIVSFVVVAHYVLGIPVKKLFEPSMVFAGLTMLLAYPMYVFRRNIALKRDGLGALFVAVGIYQLIVGVLLVYYAHKFAVIPTKHAFPLEAIS